MYNETTETWNVDSSENSAVSGCDSGYDHGWNSQAESGYICTHSLLYDTTRKIPSWL
jgi:hypothetical protein